MHFYKKSVPSKDDLIFVKADRSIKSNAGVYFHLLEYGNIEAFIPNTELDKRQKAKEPLKHIVFNSKNFKTNKVYPMRITSITPPIDPTTNDKYTIDLSYKKVNKDERDILMGKYNIISKICKLADEFHEFTQIDKNEVYNLTIRFLFGNDDDETFDPTATAEELYKNIIMSPELFVKEISKKYPKESQKYLEDLRTRIKPIEKVVKQFFTLIVADENAVEKLRNLLVYKRDGVNLGYTSSPKYHVIVTGVDDNDCSEKIKFFVSEMKKKTTGVHSIFSLGEQLIIKEQEYLLKYRKPDCIIIEEDEETDQD